MIALLPALFLSCLGLSAKPLPTPCLLGATALPHPVFVQEAADGAQEPDEKAQEPAAAKKKPEKKKFARLSSPDKKTVQAGLRAIEKGKEQEDVDAGVATLVSIGEAIIPLCLDSAARMEKVKRLEPLLLALDQVLVNDDLKLAWNSLRKKAPDAIKVYLLRRYADSDRKDASVFLKVQLKSESSAMAYEAARGMVFRGDQEALGIIEVQVRERWLKEAALLRADFASVNRKALSASLTPWLSRPRLKEKLAGLRMFELFGIEEHAKLVLPFLSESDTSLRLAAINACRVVVAKEEPLGRPSMTEIIERAESWKAKL